MRSETKPAGKIRPERREIYF